MFSMTVVSLLAPVIGRTVELDHQVFAVWKSNFNVSYATENEELHRFQIFRQKMDYIETRNAEDTAVYAPDELADRTRDEFKLLRVGSGARVQSCLQSGPPSRSAQNIHDVLAASGTDIDWSTKGAVTPIKNQGQYGTCWSFGSTGIMEGMSVVQGGNVLESLSEQELIDCSNCYGYVGCTLSDYYIPNHYAPVTEDSYPYKGSGGTCRRSSASLSHSKAASVVCEPNGANNNQDAVLADLVQYGPGGYLVGSDCLDSYSHGIISNCPLAAGSIDHATLLVGAGEENGVEYFKVKNSWGTSHGEAGYFRVKRNTNPPQLGSPGGIFGVYDGAPTPSPAPVPISPSPVPVPAPVPVPTPSGSCHAISAVATDDWCNTNCHAGFCPADLCKCDSAIIA